MLSTALPDLCDSQTSTYTQAEGSNVTVGCTFAYRAAEKLLCKGDCTTGVILMQTTNNTAQSGRYSIEFIGNDLTAVMYVHVSDLNKSDSGLYTCSLGETWFPSASQEFSINVTDGES